MGMSLLDITDGHILKQGSIQKNLHGINMKKKASHTEISNSKQNEGVNSKPQDDSILTDIIEQVNESKIDLLSTFNGDANTKTKNPLPPKKKRVRKFSSTMSSNQDEDLILGDLDGVSTKPRSKTGMGAIQHNGKMPLFPNTKKKRNSSKIKSRKKRMIHTNEFSGINMDEFKNLDYENLSNYGGT